MQPAGDRAAGCIGRKKGAHPPDDGQPWAQHTVSIVLSFSDSLSPSPRSGQGSCSLGATLQLLPSLRAWEHAPFQAVLLAVLAVPGPSHRRLLCVSTELSLITLHWFLTAFASVVHIRLLLRLWDLFFYEGSLVLFQTTLGMLRLKVLLRPRPCRGWTQMPWRPSSGAEWASASSFL